MGVVIDDPQTEAKIRELAARTGETPEQAVAHAVDARLAQLPASRDEKGRDGDVTARRERIRETLAYFDSLPKINEHLTPDEIIGYDENGLPT
ncbi:type II toxin-antitoxin system VapB family antitoxin [Rhodoplanes sp. TEM]|uniref:Type II toxin-antitoxin system VapB family antitoxin n=1 Tax=Rhodoplanes tepidamans TaxID=200616 RepID=A0ABT5JIF5_RHOTP|nr:MULTISPECIES: type II toxin-antitoxin system VapB family antitoxin [Rhodoplanes]MDC7789141.1 type II toxin-antitoxin system VapB family antitoxin [Rhodoplanes tepidamans]MDC7987647.1 type II toxin-antitoxin system VapB family antitoxin [Rhodoplanes sp. TEM]MDQ0358511.1 antitoxin VapB [Rhodoplanes tepidamans]